MKWAVIIGITLVLLPDNALGQEHYLWLKLSDGKVVLNAVYQRIEGDTLIIKIGVRRLDLHLSSVERVRIIRESSIFEGTLVGAAIGFGAGVAFGYLVRRNDAQSPLSTAAMLTVAGGVVGAVKSAMERPDPIVDLHSMSNSEKQSIIERLMSENN